MKAITLSDKYMQTILMDPLTGIVVLLALVLGEAPVMQMHAEGGQEQKTQAAERPAELAIEQIKKSVVYIVGRYDRDGKQETSVATGFFIFVPEPRLGGRGFVWLVTNKHVLQEKLPDGTPGPYLKEVTVRYNLNAPRTGGIQYAEVRVPVLDEAGHLVWFIDPEDATVDLALFQLTPNESVVDARWIGTDLFATAETLREQKVNENDEVLFAGLFTWYPGWKKNYPIVRHGKIALLPEERIQLSRDNPLLTADLYLAEITSFGGNSGSPVFLRIGGMRETISGSQLTGYRYFLLGVMKGFFPEASEFAVEVKEIRRGATSQNSGIALVVPAHRILKILETPSVKSLIDSLVSKEQLKRP